MATFGLTPSASAYPTPAAEDFPNFIQFQADGTDLGGADADTVDFVGMTATRGTGEAAGKVTVRPKPMAWRTTESDTALVLTDADCGVATTGTTGAQSVTVPADATADLPIGSAVLLYQAGAATLRVQAEAGVTLSFRGAFLAEAAGQHATLSLIKQAANAWVLCGDLAAGAGMLNPIQFQADGVDLGEADATGVDFTNGGTGAVTRTGGKITVDFSKASDPNGAMAATIAAMQTSAEQVRVNVLDKLTFAERLDVSARGHNYDIGAKIQAASDALYMAGGGVLYFPSGDYSHSVKLWAKQGVTWEGDSFGMVNQYITGYMAGRGSCLFRMPGSTMDASVEIKCDLTLTDGVLYDTGKTSRNSEARHSGGMRRMTIDGNRSATFTPESVDLNSTGDGLRITAARYVVLQDVMVFRAPVDGLSTTSYNYGTGLIGVNNLYAENVVALSCGRDGMYLSIGDSRIVSPYNGFCGRNGITATLGNTQIMGGSSWNNRYRGVYLGPTPVSSISQIIGHMAYDNDGPGFTQDGSPRVTQIVACLSRGNGRNSQGLYSSSADLSNYVVSAACVRWAIVASKANPYDQDGVKVSKYNAFINATANPGKLDVESDEDGVLGDVYMFSPAYVNRPTIGTPMIAMSDAEDVRTSVTGGILDVGYIGEIVFSSSSPIVINTITYPGKGRPKVTLRNVGTGTVTLTHDTSKIRVNSGSNLVIGQYQCYRFKSVNSANTVWQQEG